MTLNARGLYSVVASENADFVFIQYYTSGEFNILRAKENVELSERDYPGMTSVCDFEVVIRVKPQYETPDA